MANKRAQHEQFGECGGQTVAGGREIGGEAQDYGSSSPVWTPNFKRGEKGGDFHLAREQVVGVM